jgi:hypothetical protein
MTPNRDSLSSLNVSGPAKCTTESTPVGEEDDLYLHRWMVTSRSGTDRYPVGEYIAVDEAAAIRQAIEVLGPGEDYRAEKIPWDTAPLFRNGSNSAGRPG